MDERTYTLKELKSLISESATEFKAKLGNDVVSNDKKNNQTAYSDAQKRAKELNGVEVQEPKKKELPEKIDDNKTTLDYTFDTDPGKEYKKRIKAQAKGYTSAIEEENDIEKAGDFNDDIYQQFKKSAQERAKKVEMGKKAGLTAREAPAGTFKKEDMFESKKISVLNFKSTTFLNESQMISKIPDDYKVDGNRFKVKDAGENEFIVEWVDGEANILSYENKKKLNESKDKFFHLMGYNSKDHVKNSTNYSRLAESTEFRNILEKVRETIKDNK